MPDGTHAMPIQAANGSWVLVPVQQMMPMMPLTPMSKAANMNCGTTTVSAANTNVQTTINTVTTPSHTTPSQVAPAMPVVSRNNSNASSVTTNTNINTTNTSNNAVNNTIPVQNVNVNGVPMNLIPINFNTMNNLIPLNQLARPMNMPNVNNVEQNTLNFLIKIATETQYFHYYPEIEIRFVLGYHDDCEYEYERQWSNSPVSTNPTQFISRAC
jgi:hypothetical protein